MKTLLAAFILLAASGCAALSPATDSCAAFRRGVEAVDQPLYDVADKLADDATAAGVRSPQEAAILHAATRQGRALYAEAHAATQPAAKP